MNFPRAFILAALATMAAGTAHGESATLFARVDKDADNQPRALQLAVNSYVRNGVTVDLVGAIHIGDEAYYAELNDRFRGYDSVLFELVAPPGVDFAGETDKRQGILSNAQGGLTHLLGLTFQLEQIDYGQPNFVHADLSPDELRKSMAERNESLYTYFWRLFFASVNEYTRDPLGLRDWQLLSAMLSEGEDPSFKVLMAYEMTSMDAVRELLGEDSDSAIIGARNERAIEVLHRELDSGSRRVGIFYGVAHMPDLEERLLGAGFKFAGTDWVDAWNLQAE